jgi:hypothetical protein
MKSFLRRLELWGWAYLFAWGLAIVRSVIHRVRMSHNNGVVGFGTLKIVDTPVFPAHEFFWSGRTFPCRIRHASVTYPDDAAMQVRSGSLKFDNTPWKSPLDIEMNTGTTSLFWSARNFFAFARATRQVGWVTYKDYYHQHAEVLSAAREGVRDGPASFALLRYHSQTPTLFLARDGVTRYVKYRLLPEDTSQPETGIPSPERLATVWDARPLENDMRDRNYLKDEYATRVTRGPVRYLLQLQLHVATPGDTDDIFNSNKAWDEATHPWIDLAQVEITQVGTWQDAVLTRTSLSNAPQSLAIIPARDMDDPNSLNYMRVKSNLVKRVRVFMDESFSVPKRPTNRRIPGNNPWY